MMKSAYAGVASCLALAMMLAPTGAAAKAKPSDKTATATMANREVHYGNAPDWVSPPPAGTGTTSGGENAGESDSPVHVVWSDSEQRVTPTSVTTYTASRIRLLRPEALQIGNLSLVWNPDTTQVTVNRLVVYRDGQVIPVLDTARFQIFQREGGLEQAMLNGELTANLQIPGLRVGDEIEFVQTQVRRNSVFGDRQFDVVMLNSALAPGRYRMGVSWAGGEKPVLRPSADLAPALTKTDGSIIATLTDPGKFVAPDGAPARYAAGRYIEYSDFSRWQDVSAAWYPLFERSATIAATSPLHAEIDRIRAASSDPRAQALAALALVQDKVRYVYTGMDDGNYTPAPADQTWERRFGDCKGKTALLMALLHGLGIEAQAVIVNSGGGDGIDEHLPSPAMFDHVVVTLTMNGQRLWLDGTRQSEHRLLTDAEVPYRQFLPVSAQGTDLTHLPYHIPRFPMDLTFTDIDDSAGVDKPAKIRIVSITRGDTALGISLGLSSMPHDAAVEAMRRGMSGGWITPDTIDWSYDTANGTLTMTTVGTAKLDWEDDDHTFYLPGGGFYAPAELKRPKEQDQSAPYANKPGEFSCSVTRMRMPSIPNMHWGVTAKSIDRSVGGIAYYRRAQIEDGVVSQIRSSRTMQDEITPDEAKVANGQITAFDNNKTYVSQITGKGPSTELDGKPMVSFDAVDWANAPDPCLPARLREALPDKSPAKS
ncbi:DUF3857 and transglutaminase domain-containing protein [Novosphingobium sp. 9]|uniref:DUF3857 and transglutaminase domain-containing protein n=1 Tax=Novosphingobium sp. 9 TaxID=2025349 RepID=UPI0021B5B1F6|nr:DUF3857 and transglutaminase domain-containing protein [Novosphingobium sp. 9]